MGKSAGARVPPPAVPGAVPVGTLPRRGRHAGDCPVTGRLDPNTARFLPTVDSPTEDAMAEKKNRRASVQLNVRLEPAEAALIKRVIPKGSLRAVTVSLLVEHARELEAQMPAITEGDATAA